MSLERVSETDKELRTKTAELEALKKAAEIATKSALSELTVPAISKTEIKGLLCETLDQVAADAERQIKEHIREHLYEEHP